MLTDIERAKYREIARRIRFDVIKMTYHAGSGHPGGSLSLVELFTMLYFKHLVHKPNDPNWQDRDRLVLSKGHACPALYAVLAESGYYPREEMWTLRKFGSRLQGHPAKDKGLPGIEVSTGSLGQGLSIAIGMAISAKMFERRDNRIFAILGDGEIQEGQVWEAFMSASHFKLDNLIAIIDNNNLQIDGYVDKVMCIYPLKEKLQAFGWRTITCNGHSLDEVDKALEIAREKTGKPTVIIIETIKGKGISFMNNKAEWHGKAPSREQALIAVTDLGYPENVLDKDID